VGGKSKKDPLARGKWEGKIGMKNKIPWPEEKRMKVWKG
jgi:hypothetical protein